MEDLKTIPNGEKVRRTFSDRELARRQAALRGAMAQEGIDAAFLTSIHNINYFADFLYCSFGRSYGLAIDAGSATLISANIDGGQPWRRAFADNLVYTDWRRDNFYRAAQKVLPQSGVIGAELDHLPAAHLEKLKAARPNCRIKDIAPAAMNLRTIKSEEEIALIKSGAQVCDIGGQAAAEAVCENAPEYEIALAATQAMVREIARRYPHSELMDTWTWFQSGVNTDGAHNPVTARRIKRGDILSLNCFSMIAGYYTALERTMFFDFADDESLRLWEINVKVHEAGLKMIKPGAKCCDIAAALNEIYREYNLLQYRTFGYGHSFGVLCHYYGREAAVELREDIETTLAPGMVVSMEPMIMLPQDLPGAGGYREHDILVLGENGAENITAFPFGPAHNIIKKRG